MRRTRVGEVFPKNFCYVESVSVALNIEDIIAEIAERVYNDRSGFDMTAVTCLQVTQPVGNDGKRGGLLSPCLPPLVVK